MLTFSASFAGRFLDLCLRVRHSLILAFGGVLCFYCHSVGLRSSGQAAKVKRRDKRPRAACVAPQTQAEGVAGERLPVGGERVVKTSGLFRYLVLNRHVWLVALPVLRRQKTALPLCQPFSEMEQVGALERREHTLTPVFQLR